MFTPSAEKMESPDINPHNLWSINLQQKKQQYTTEKTVSSVSGAEKIEQLQVKECRPFPNTTHKNKLKMD